MSTYNGIPIMLDNESDNGLLGSLFPQGMGNPNFSQTTQNQILEGSPFGDKSIFEKEPDGNFVNRYIDRQHLAEKIIKYSVDKSIMKYYRFHYNDGINFSDFIIDNNVYDVSTEINVLTGEIDFSKQPNFRFEFDLKNQKAKFKLLYEYKKFKNSADYNRFAIILTFNKYIDLEVFFNKLGKQLADQTKQSIEKEFNNALLLARGKSEVLDFIYETIPDFVLIKRNVKELYADLSLLSTKTIDSIGTNENIAVINIIDAISKKDLYDKYWFYNEVNSNPATIRVLFEKLNRKHVEKLLILTTSIGHNFWKKDELKKAWDYAIDYSLFTASESKKKDYNDPYILYTGFAYYNKTRKKYKIGTAIFQYTDNNSILADNSTEIGPPDLKFAFDPMKLKLENGELHIPCFVAEYFTNEKINEEWWTMLNNLVPLILIESTAATRGATIISKLLSSGKKIKTVDELIIFLDKVDESILVTDLEKVGIKILFRGTTRNAQGDLYIGNTNSILNGTSTSTDPIRAVIFGLESSSRQETKGVLQIYITKDLEGLNLLAPNRRVEKELEVIIKTSPENLTKFVTIEIDIENARKLINELYSIDLDSKITSQDYSTYLLENTKKLTPEEALEFYKKTLKKYE